MADNKNICRFCNSYMQLQDFKIDFRKCTCGNTVVEKPMVTLEQYYMGRDKKYPKDLTAEITANAKELLDKVNMFLKKLGLKEVTVNSGWRPAAVNDATANAAKKSNHTMGLAIDLGDADGKIWKLVLENLEEAKRLGLYFEDKRWTPTWVHIQCRPPKSKKRIYVPSSAAASAPKAWDGKYDKKFDS